MGAWMMARLGDYIEQIRGVSYKPEDAVDVGDTTHIPVLRAHNIQGKNINGNNLIYVSTKKIKQHQYIQKGDIVVCASSGSKDLVGKAAQAQRDMMASFGAFCKVVRPQKRIDASYLKHYFFSPFYRHTISELSSGANINNLRNEHIDDLKIPMPPQPTQEKIADVLDSASLLVEKRKTQIEKLDLLVKSQFIEMFSGKKYDYVDLISLIEGGAGLSYGIVQPGDDKTGDMGVLRPVDFVDGGISTSEIKYIDRSIGDGYKRTELTGEELLITVRGTTGITALSDGRFKGMNVTRGIAVIRYRKDIINPLYLNEYLKSDESQFYIQENTKGIALKQINLSDLRQQPMLLPPLPLQNRFAEFVSAADKSKFALQRGLDKLELLYKSLMQKCFSGEMF